MFNIHMLPGGFGDCILIEFGDTDQIKYILIDGGPYYQFDEIITKIREKIPELKEIDLLVITHVDIDHIDGIIRLLNHEPKIFQINQIWFNDYADLNYEHKDTLGGLQGEYLTLLAKHNDLRKNDKPITIHRKKEELLSINGLEIIIVNPTQVTLKELVEKWNKHLKEKGMMHDEDKIWQELNGDKRYSPLPHDLLGSERNVKGWANMKFDEDKSHANRSSIAFIIKYKDKSCLLAGDAPSTCLKENLKQLKLLDEFGQLFVDVWKLSHHGSKKSTQDYLTRMIQTRKILICTNGKRYKHPDKETVAKLLVNQKSHLSIYFNYTSQYNTIWCDQNLTGDYNCTFHYPIEEGYMKVDVLSS